MLYLSRQAVHSLAQSPVQVTNPYGRFVIQSFLFFLKKNEEKILNWAKKEKLVV